jgi:hypothetical protein
MDIVAYYWHMIVNDDWEHDLVDYWEYTSWWD